MSHAKFKGAEDICAIEVDDNFNCYEKERDKFSCIFCGVKVQFSRGKNHDDPHFKNWPLTDHKSDCGDSLLKKQLERYPNEGEVETLVSTILPRAQRLNTFTHNMEIVRGNKAKVFGGRRTKQYIYTLSNLLDERNFYNIKADYNDLEFIIEDGTRIKLVDLFGTQDEIINRMQALNEDSRICVLKGTTKTVIHAKNNIIIPLTKGNKPNYKNTKDFSLFIKWDYRDKNIDFLSQIENSLIVCYGEATNTDYGYQMEIFSIKHQVVILKRFNKK